MRDVESIFDKYLLSDKFLNINTNCINVINVIVLM